MFQILSRNRHEQSLLKAVKFFIGHARDQRRKRMTDVNHLINRCAEKPAMACKQTLRKNSPKTALIEHQTGNFYYRKFPRNHQCLYKRRGLFWGGHILLLMWLEGG